MGKVKVDLKTAVDFAGQGFEIECFVITGSSASVKKVDGKLRRSKQMSGNQHIGLAVGGQVPRHGKLGAAFAEIKRKLRDDPTAHMKISTARDIFEKHGAGRSGAAKMVNTYKCMRLVEVDEK